MKKVLVLFLVCLTLIKVNAEVLEGGVLLEKIPEELFGNWRVNATLEVTNSPSNFKPKSMDFWNLIRKDDKISLVNPYSGANTSISVNTVEGNLVVFSKKANYGQNKILTDTVTLRLNKDSFTGINILKLESYSLIDNHLMKTETATYRVIGEKISGQNVLVD